MEENWVIVVTLPREEERVCSNSIFWPRGFWLGIAGGIVFRNLSGEGLQMWMVWLCDYLHMFISSVSCLCRSTCGGAAASGTCESRETGRRKRLERKKGTLHVLPRLPFSPPRRPPAFPPPAAPSIWLQLLSRPHRPPHLAFCRFFFHDDISYETALVFVGWIFFGNFILIVLSFHL